MDRRVRARVDGVPGWQARRPGRRGELDGATLAGALTEETGAAGAAEELEGQAERDHRGARNRWAESYGSLILDTKVLPPDYLRAPLPEEIPYLDPLLHVADPDAENFVNGLHIENCADL